MTESNDFFSATSEYKINVFPLPMGTNLPSLSDFIDEIPDVFRIASQCGLLDNQLNHDPTTKHTDVPPAVQRLLSIQNQKLDLLISLLLRQQNETGHEYTATSIGGSQITFSSDRHFVKDTPVKVHLFLTDPLVGIYCYGKIIESQEIEKNPTLRYQVRIMFTLIQESDRDLLIRAALLAQQHLLRQRAKHRKT